MINRLSVVLLLSSLALPVRAEKDSFKVMHVADLSAALNAPKPSTVCYANTKDVRKKAGVIPGAILLTSSSKFNVAKELPADKSTALVFYCANTQCMASHGAADRAKRAGYKNISVLVDGILGWKEAGQPTTPVSKLR